MSKWLLVLVLLPQFAAYAQIDPGKLDSLSRVIDSSAKAHRLSEDSAIRFQDSSYRSEVNKALRQNPRNSDDVSTAKKKREANERQKIIVRLIAGILFLTVFIIAWTRRKRKT
jgi:hypothetical protein